MKIQVEVKVQAELRKLRLSGRKALLGLNLNLNLL